MPNHTRQLIYPAGEMGVNGLLLTAAANSNGRGCATFNQLSLEFILTWGAASTVTFFIATSPDGGTTWGRIQASDLAATGVETLTDRQWSKAVSATKAFVVNVPINAEMFRVESITGAGATTDSVAMRAILGVV